MASSSNKALWPVLTLIIGAYLLLTALPQSAKSWAPSWLQPTLHLGLDLQGGTQLDFRISEAEILKQIERLEEEVTELEAINGSPEEIEDKKAQISNLKFQQRNIVEAIRTVLERRVNSLGVSEAVITPSYYGDEKHLLVECPGVVDIQQCISTVGKTILLEFKEQFEGEDKEHEEAMRALAQKAQERLDAGETLATVGADLGPTLGVFYAEQASFQDNIPEAIADVWDRDVDSSILAREITVDPITQPGGEEMEHRGFMFAEVISPKVPGERTFTDPVEAIEYLAESNENLTLIRHEDIDPANLYEGYKEAFKTQDPLGSGIRAGSLVQTNDSDGNRSILFVESHQVEQGEIEASHILIAYGGAARADHTITRTRARAEEKARDLKSQLNEGANFARLARNESDGPSATEGGSLGSFGPGVMAPAFEQAAFALQNVGDISDVIETEFGFHIIRLDAPLSTIPGSITYLELKVSGEDDAALQEQTLQALETRTVTRTEDQLPLRTLFFSYLPTGWKDTALDGKHFRRATVTTDPLTGIPVVQIVFDSEGGDLFYELTKRNVGKPIAIFVGGELVSAPNVQTEIPGGIAIITGSANFDEANQLAQDLNTGAIPAPIHLVGQVTVEPSLGAEAMKQSINAALLGFLLVGIYMIFYYRVLGLIAAVSLSIYAVIFTALLKLPLFLFTDQYVVLTLAGIAGIILSIGMAVDANVLIFERMKEELKKGKMLQTAADTGFKRAWSAIRDSNISTLLTALILFIIGTSIVRGFAVTLSMGILISMFTAVVITRFLIRMLYKSPIAENLQAFGIALNQSHEKN